MSDSEQTVVNTGAPGAAKIYGVVLILGVVCALAIVTVYEVTKPIIRRNQIALRQRAILKVLPGASSSAAFRVDRDSNKIEETSPDAEGSDLVFAGYDDKGKLVGLAIETAGMGYQDTIRLLYGYSFTKQAVIGTSVLESRETPGLGDRIEKDEKYLANFESLDVSLNDEGTEVANPIKFVKPGEKEFPWQIDGITGATISSQAVSDMLQASTADWIPRVHSRQADFMSTKKEGE
jgi:electron transport complex protein RnfG